MRRPHYIALGALALVAGWPVIQTHVDAYSTNGYRWATSSVPYYVNPQSTQLEPSQVVDAVRAAADVWNTQPVANIELTYAGSTSGSTLTLNYRNEVFFRNEASPNGYTAATYWWYNGSGTLIDADIVFYENHQWFSGGAGCTSGYYVENTGAHEFGHALGLGHSDSAEATMWGNTTACMTSKQTLEADDIAGLEALYPPTSESPPPPPSTEEPPTEEPAPEPPTSPGKGGRGGGRKK